VRTLADDPTGFDRQWWKRGAELGWTSVLVPEALGGGSVSGDGVAAEPPPRSRCSEFRFS